MMSHVNFSDFRAKLASHLDQVETDRTELTVTRQGHEPMVVLPLRELESLKETLHLLSTPANATRLLRAKAQLDAGKGVQRELEE